MSILELESPKVLKNIKQATFTLLLLILLSDFGLNWLYVHAFYDIFSIPGLYTAGLIQPHFVLNVFKLAFIVYGLVFWIGRFRRYQVGLNWKNIRLGALTMFFMWSILQSIEVAYNVVSQGDVGYRAWLNVDAILLFVGHFLFFAVGKALFDEIVYRGLLLPQLHLKLMRYVNLPDRVLLALSILISQTIYFVIQLPLIDLIIVDEFTLPVTATSLFILGILNALVYLQTKNLFLTIGIHTLWYAPLFVVNPTIPHTLILTISVIVFIVLWPMLPNSPSMTAPWPLDKRFGR